MILDVFLGQTGCLSSEPDQLIHQIGADALWAWSQEAIGRRLLKELGPMSADRLKWEIALHCYGREKQLGPLIRRILADVHGRVVSLDEVLAEPDEIEE